MAPADEDKRTISVVLRAQVICKLLHLINFHKFNKSTILGIEWTTQADFGILPAPWINGSLLILGTRAGILTFLRFSSICKCSVLSLLSDNTYSRYRTGESPEHVTSLSVADSWITHLAFSTWNSVKPGYCKIYLTA